jgi:hypothetical protein
MAALEFFKLYTTFFTGSISEEELHVRIVFLAMCSMSDEEGGVNATVSAIARFANVSKEQALGALQVLQAPDPESTTEEHDGRRVLLLGPNRWLVVNKRQYYEKGGKGSAGGDRKDYMRDYMKDYRARKKGEAGGVNANVNSDVNSVNPKEEQIRKEEREKKENIEEGSTDHVFEAIFVRLANAYPKRPSGGTGLEEGKAIFRDLYFIDCVDPEEIILGAENYALYFKSRSAEEQKFIKKLPKWLEGKGWKETYTLAEIQPESGKDYHWADHGERDSQGNPPPLARFWILNGEKTKIPFDEQLWRARRADSSIPLPSVVNSKQQPANDVEPQAAAGDPDPKSLSALELAALQEQPSDHPRENIDFYWRQRPPKLNEYGPQTDRFSIIGGLKTAMMFDERYWYESRGL